MRLILHTLLVSQILISTLTAGSSQRIIDDVVTGIRQICLPDGMSLYGDSNAVIGKPCFTTPPQTDADILPTFTKLVNALKDPRKPNDAWYSFFSSEVYTPKEVLDLYQTLVHEAAKLNPEALLVFQIMLRSGEISGSPIPGLQIQPERAKIYDVLYKWRKNFPLTDDEQTLLGEISSRGQSSTSATSYVSEPKPLEHSNLRRRHVIVKTPSDDKHLDAEYDPLLRPVKAH